VSTQWIVTPRPNPRASIRLVLLADLGGSAATFRGWSERLPTANLGVVQLPGRESRLREPFVQSVAEAAQAVADEVVVGGQPAVLFGHGLGALIAFETARCLETRHWPVLALFVSGQSPPALATEVPRLADAPADELLEQLKCRRHVLPGDVAADPDALRIALPIVRADLAIIESYRYESREPLRWPLIACDAVAEPHVSRDDVEGWRRETTGRFSVQRFGGDRSYIQREHEALTVLVGNHLSVLAGALARSALIPG
jgi:medium-chain acyl-[acyl-carrier-protein] hydrolase